MSKHLFTAAFAIGLAVVAWVGLGFVGTHGLALAMTAVIAATYLFGAFELRQYRAATRSLAQAVDGVSEPVTALGAWLERVPAPLRDAVRLRIESERGGLPGPALTPYLVGLLVMLGMLGTFLGMVVTFRGTVFALEGSTDLQAMRSALAEPIKGLGLSFGTSVAGVAASAMLGLMSAISRRERLEVASRLDQLAATVLRPFSLAHQRHETLGALQAQALSLPRLVERIEAMMARMDERGERLDRQLADRQAEFHREAGVAYTGLAESVGASLKDSLAAGAQAAGQSIQPVVEAAMTRIVQQSERVHERLAEVSRTQVDALSQQFGATAGSVAEGWTRALDAHSRTSTAMADELKDTLARFGDTFAARSTELLAGVDERLARSRTEHAQAEQQRLDAWTKALQYTAESLHAQWQRVGDEALARQQQVSESLERSAGEIAERVGTQAARALEDVSRLLDQSHELVRVRTEAEARFAEQHGERMDQLAGVWRSELAALRHDESQRGEAAVERLEQLAGLWRSELAALRHEESQRGEAAASRMDQIAAVWRSELSNLRSEESQRGEAAVARMDQLAQLWRGELATLRNDEAQRGEAAVARLGELQQAVSQHLASLGAALEAPLTRLLNTASEVPQAAAGVITQLRQEMSRLAEQDASALAERTALLERFGALLETVNKATGDQRAAVDALVVSATAVMDQAGSRFAQALDAQAGQSADMAAQVAGSAVELASLAEAFGHGVQQFQATNEKLVETLQRIEGSLTRSTARSDEQLAYYVAQAREVIDLSIASQQGLVENLRQLQGRPGKTLALAGDPA